jgi:cation diffusion facilitator CzcD-associated flavoprotein CzcO
MTTETDSSSLYVDRWLAQLERTICATDPGDDFAALFHDDSHWRDVLALTWDIRTANGLETIASTLPASAMYARPRGFMCDRQRTPPRVVTRAGVRCIEAIFTFRTVIGRCNGVLRLTPAEGNAGPKAWTLMTALDEIEGGEEMAGLRRPRGKALAGDFRGPNWLDRRKASAAYADRDPAVLVVGAGQAGLSIAARLNHLGVDTLVVERNDRIGDNWRKRYHALALHNQVHVNHLPYLEFPAGWPTYIPKDKLANWFEAYAEIMEVNAWTGTSFEGATYDEHTRRWTGILRLSDGTSRTLRPRHIVMAASASGVAHIPAIPTLEEFGGPVLHSSRFGDGEAWRGKRVMVIGTGTSGHDIAQDLHSAGAHVAIVQRSTTMVVNIEPSAQLPYTLYEEGPPLADCDLITVGVPLPLLKRSYQLVTEAGAKIDKPLLDRLEAKGFRLDFGEEGTGWQYKYLTRGGGYYFNVGCSELIADGEIELIQYNDIERFTADGALLRGGNSWPADLIVLATGYKGQDVLVRQLLGDRVADLIGPIWGFGEDQELRNMFKRTAQPGLWFIAGSFAQCRIYSKYLALQIKGSEMGLLPRS